MSKKAKFSTNSLALRGDFNLNEDQWKKVFYCLISLFTSLQVLFFVILPSNYYSSRFSLLRTNEPWHFATEGYIVMVLCQINLTFVEIISLYVRRQTCSFDSSFWWTEIMASNLELILRTICFFSPQNSMCMAVASLLHHQDSQPFQ